jgi:hypothetical protein
MIIFVSILTLSFRKLFCNSDKTTEEVSWVEDILQHSIKFIIIFMILRQNKTKLVNNFLKDEDRMSNKEEEILNNTDSVSTLKPKFNAQMGKFYHSTCSVVYQLG